MGAHDCYLRRKSMQGLLPTESASETLSHVSPAAGAEIESSTVPGRKQDNNVLNAAAALLSIPSQLAATTSSASRSSPGPAHSLESSHSTRKSHAPRHHTSTALMDLVSPLAMIPLTSTLNDPEDAATTENAVYYEGTCSLSLPEDEDFLSPLHSFIRRYCVEAFTATAQDASESQFGRSHGSRVVPGQVGIRCCFCSNKQASTGASSHHSHGGGTVQPHLRRERAVCFPSSLKNIYHSIETWQRRHSLVCEDIPSWVKASMTELCKTSKSGAGGRRQYWEDSARRIGLANTSHGIRFIRPPGDMGPPVLIAEDVAAAASGALRMEDERRSGVAMMSERMAPLLNLESIHLSEPVVDENDRSLVKDYLYVLLSQMEQCYFSEEDRAGGRSKVKDCPIGYPGMQCRHCKGKAGFGRYFPGTLAALTSANSDRNIFNHIIKCRRCPQHIKDDLNHLQKQHQTLKNRRGSRKLFFEKIWERLHGDRTAIHASQQDGSQPALQVRAQQPSMMMHMMHVPAHAM